MAFTEKLTYRELTVDERVELSQNPKFVAAQLGLANLIKARTKQ